MRVTRALLWLLALFVTGCSTIESPVPSLNSSYLYPFTEDEWGANRCYERFFNVDLYKAMAEMIEDIPANPKVRVVVADFVNIVTLRTDSKLGFMLADNLKTALLKKHKFRLVEAKLSKYFIVGRNGLRILSDRADELKKRYLDLRYAIVGDYFLTTKRIIVTIKMIDLKNQEIVYSDQTELPLTCELYDLSESGV